MSRAKWFALGILTLAGYPCVACSVDDVVYHKFQDDSFDRGLVGLGTSRAASFDNFQMRLPR